MSIPVELSDLEAQSARFPAAFLISVDPEHAPRVNAITPTVTGSEVRFQVGKRTSTYLSGNPKATLFFPPPPGDTFALLVDGTAHAEDQAVVFTPTWAVLHQTARGD